MTVRRTLSAFATLAVLALGALPAAAQQIGTVASSEPTLRGTPPGAGTRTLSIGTGVVVDERVTSSPTGRGQLLFADQSTLSLAPNTTIILDRFVYDPNRGAGEMGLTLTEGALRFIGGSLSRGQEALVTTPTSTIGIRGSTVLIIVLNGETIAVFVAGERLCITSRATGRRACTSRQGGVLTEDGYQGRVNPDFLARVLELIDGAPGDSSGGQGGLGSGVNSPNPSDRDPVSTTGEEFDPELFDDDFTFDDLYEGLREGNRPAPQAPGDGLLGDDLPDIDTDPLPEPEPDPDPGITCFDLWLDDSFGFDAFDDFFNELGSSLCDGLPIGGP